MFGWKAKAQQIAQAGVYADVVSVYEAPLYDFITAIAIMTAEQEDYKENLKKKQ